MKHDLIEHASRVATNDHASSNRRWSAVDLVDGAVEVVSGLIEVLIEILV